MNLYLSTQRDGMAVDRSNLTLGEYLDQWTLGEWNTDVAHESVDVLEV